MAQPLGTAAVLQRPGSAHVMDYALPAAILLAVLVAIGLVLALGTVAFVLNWR